MHKLLQEKICARVATRAPWTGYRRHCATRYHPYGRVHRLEVVAEDSGAPQPPIGKGDGDHEKQHGANGNADEHPQAQTQAPNSTAAAPKYTIV
jgi:hypothetical protein